VARLSLMLLRRKAARALTGEPIALAPKTLGHGTRYWAGGILFGVGWALTGACPGPLVALIGSGATSISSRSQAPLRARGRMDGRGRTCRIED